MKKVGRTFGGRRVLRDVDLTIQSGEAVLIKGPNGSGKTTLLRILSSLLPPSEGSISFFEEELAEADLPNLRKQMGLLSTESFLYGDLTIEENLLFYASLYELEQAKELVRHWINTFSLQMLAHEPVRTLSRGEKQKAALARAFLHAPSILLLDEPTTGLDESSRETLSSLLRERKGKVTMVCTSHDPSFMADWADRSLSLKSGRLT